MSRLICYIDYDGHTILCRQDGKTEIKCRDCSDEDVHEEFLKD